MNTEKINIKLTNFQNSLSALKETFDYKGDESKSIEEIINVAKISRFTITYELAWKTLKEFIKNEGEGNEKIIGSRDVFRAALVNNIIDETQVWFDMVDTRNKISHEYLQQNLEDYASKIGTFYLPELIKLENTLSSIYEKNTPR
jgi:nucleotidyltransferase substrate binding protein (TIGR01987 family)